MIETLRTYNDQFKFVPQIINGHLIKKNYKHIILCGMGGSHLPVGILKTIQPGIDIYVHRDYDLPPFDKSFFEHALLVASSYSGNTAEVISFYKKAKQLFDVPVVCIATGGELISLATAHNDPYIILPQSHFVPRTALGFSTIALASLLHDKTIFEKLSNLHIDIAQVEQSAQTIVASVQDATPVFYASTQNMHMAYNWKIKFNETAKRHAFYNVFPESNHNELEGYEFSTNKSAYIPVLLRDTQDDPRINARFDAFETLLKEKGIQTFSIELTHTDPYQRVFRSIILGDFVSALLSQKSGVVMSEVPLIEEFKKRII